MLTVHHLGKSQSERIVWLCEELEIPYELKRYARAHPHTMGAWSRDSKSHVAHMTAGDFYANEQAAVIDRPGSLRIELVGAGGASRVLKESVAVENGPASAMGCPGIGNSLLELMPTATGAAPYGSAPMSGDESGATESGGTLPPHDLVVRSMPAPRARLPFFNR